MVIIVCLGLANEGDRTMLGSQEGLCPSREWPMVPQVKSPFSPYSVIPTLPVLHAEPESMGAFLSPPFSGQAWRSNLCCYAP